MPQFDVTTFPSQIFWLIICFVFLCGVMARYLVPRLTTSIGIREQRLQEDWSQSKDLRAQGQALRQENLARLSEARGKAHAHIHQILAEIHHRKTSRLAVLDEELILKTKNIREDLKEKTHKILGNIEPLVSQVIKATSPRLLGQSLSQAEIKELVLEVLEKGKKSS
ncbi:MAG: hypothetical protein K2Y18_06870 [Alphaproteobacteria bacterium]|jgi:F-type H+-transporting ATPase subunit b|nr:hypothetical protein [Alphaproteobacteria bacterium]